MTTHQDHPPSRPEFSMLPDEILVKIGMSVARVCDIKDFVSLSSCSKRLKMLLLDSEPTVSKVIRIRTSMIESSQPPLLASCSPKTQPISESVRTLQQLEFCESVARHRLLEENRLYGQHDNFLDCSFPAPTTPSYSEIRGRIDAVQDILRKYPSATIVLDAHTGTQAPDQMADMLSFHRGTKVREALSSRMLHRIDMRAWGKKVSVLASASKHPHGTMARQGKGWVEVFVRLETMSRRGRFETTIELPPRPEFYHNKAIRMPDELM